MGNYQASFFENYPLNGLLVTHATNGFMVVNAYYIPASISFNKVNILFGASGTTAKTASLSFGLYSLNGATLSLANSASRSTNPAVNVTDWLSMATSAAQNITPGMWYFAFMSSTSSNSLQSVFMNPNLNGSVEDGVPYAGPFVRGRYSVTTGAFPASIATSDMRKEGSTGFNTVSDYRHPYVILSA